MEQARCGSVLGSHAAGIDNTEEQMHMHGSCLGVNVLVWF